MTDVGFVRMRVSKVVGLRDGDRAREFVVLEEPGGDRSSDALNLAVLTAAPILAALEVLEDSDRRQEGDSAEAVLMRRALDACPLTITRLDR
jgi:hypothetical protein